MNDDLTLLASAYLDDDLTSDERARVEGDPELLDEVERLRSVRALLGDVGVASIARREEHLAAALNVWDRLPHGEHVGARRDGTPTGIDAATAGAATVTAPTRIGERRRTWSTRWLTGAAAAAILIVLTGGIALQFASGEDNDLASSAATADTATPKALANAEDAGDAAEPPAPVAASQLADAPEGAQLDTGIENAAPPPDNGGLDQLDTSADLADYAGAAVGAPTAPDVPAATSAPVDPTRSAYPGTTLPDCPGIDIIVGPAMYAGVPVMVGIDESKNMAIAYRAADCSRVASVRLP